jgi:hypothetical protein
VLLHQLCLFLFRFSFDRVIYLEWKSAGAYLDVTELGKQNQDNKTQSHTHDKGHAGSLVKQGKESQEAHDNPIHQIKSHKVNLVNQINHSHIQDADKQEENRYGSHIPYPRLLNSGIALINHAKQFSAMKLN